MKNLFCFALVACASLLSGCMSSGSDETFIPPQSAVGFLKNGDMVFVSSSVPKGDKEIINSVQFISGEDGNSGSLIISSSQELSELYFYITGTLGYYVRQLSPEDISYSGSGSYVYSVDLDFSSGMYSQEMKTEVSGKTTGETISSGKQTKNSSAAKFACNDPTTSGGDAGWIGNIDMKQTGGTFRLEYNTQSVPDKITVYDGKGIKGDVLHTYSGGTGGWVYANVTFTEPYITVEVIGLQSGTAWDFTVNCPTN